MNGRPFIRIAALSFALVASACGHHFTQTASTKPTLRPYRSIYVLPLDNLTAEPDAAKLVRHAIITQLANVPGLSVVDANLALTTDAGVPRTPYELAAELKEKHGVELIMMGAVLEYEHRSSSSPQPSAEPIVGYSLRILDTWADRIVWGGVFARSRSSSFTLGGDSIAAVTLRAARDTATSIVEVRQ